MTDAAQVLCVERIGDELQPECFAAEWHVLDAACRTVS
jgi:hypothetical protein